MNSVLSRRYLSLWLRRLSTDRVRRQSPPPADPRFSRGPLALVGAVKNARRLTAIDDAAAQAGLRVGMSFADASAIYPALAWAEAAPAEDARLLAAIAAWCERYTPLVGLDAPDGLIFDITGVAHLFGGEAALARDLLQRLASQGFHARIGIADTVGAASAAARHGRTAIIPAGQIPDALAPLPVGALRIDDETRLGLIQLGLKTIGHLMTRPRAPLAARFGEALIRRLDQALGREEEPIAPRLPVPALCVEQGFPEPLMRDQDLLAILAHLEQQLCGFLEQRGQGARHLLATFFGAGGAVNRIEIGTSLALRDVAHLHRLFTDKFALEQWDNEFGYDRIRLAVLEAEDFSASQKDLDATEEGPELAQLIDRLSARLGATRVLRIMPQDTHVPEQASVTIPAAHAKEFAPPTPSPSPQGGGEITQQDSLAPSRPIRLFERPEPIDAMAEFPDGPPVRFRWRRVLHQVVRVEGPERIAMPWWRAPSPAWPGGRLTRDYFRVETVEGARLWLFRDGLYGEAAPALRWFCHGLLP